MPLHKPSGLLRMVPFSSLVTTSINFFCVCRVFVQFSLTLQMFEHRSLFVPRKVALSDGSYCTRIVNKCLGFILDLS